MLVPVLLSGGLGARLWPISRRSFPKQFTKLTDSKHSLIQITAQRLEGIGVDRTGWIVVANNDHRFSVADQLKEVGANISNIILEPVGKNTAPAIALAAIEALKMTTGAKLLVQTADHLIPDDLYFRNLIVDALTADQPMMTFGVVPTRPETGYGYIQVGDALEASGAFSVRSFIEKPDLATAETLIDAGDYLWNSGMFILDAETYLRELQCFNPEIFSSCRSAMALAQKDLDFLRVDKMAFSTCPSLSVDHAVMERSKKVSVMPFESKWFDLGAWDAVSNVMECDDDHNVIIGDGLTKNTFGTLVRSEGRLVVALGVRDLVIAETSDVVLVAAKHAAQDVGQIVEQLRGLQRPEADEHQVGYRPWGSFESVLRSDCFHIKKIIVKPGKSLSLQSHKHRSEHWVVVEGIAEVINGEQTMTMVHNQSTYIPAGTKHRLTNPGKIDLVIIEVQTGSYFGEDDIVRLADDFGRGGEGS